MSTKSRIGILNTDGTTETIYCHWDGYPEHQLPILTKNYTTEEKVRELLELGDISALGERTAPEENEAHSWSAPAKGVTIAYHRDGGERKIRARRSKSIDDLHSADWDVNWFYLFDAANSAWLPPIKG